VKLITRNARAHRSKLIIIMGTTEPSRAERSVCVCVRLSFVTQHDWLIKHECLPLVEAQSHEKRWLTRVHKHSSLHFKQDIHHNSEDTKLEDLNSL